MPKLSDVTETGVGDRTPYTASTKSSLQETAREETKARILRGEFAAGTPLSEEIVAAELDMSRTPVRQAFQELVVLGLLERVHGRGVVVSRVDLQRTLDIIEVQQCLLEWALRRLCAMPTILLQEAIDAFERQRAGAEKNDYLTVRVEARRMDVALVTATGNREMERYMREISDLLLHAASQALVTPEVYQEAIREHGEILEALRAQDVDRATKATQVHFDGIHRRLRGFRG